MTAEDVIVEVLDRYNVEDFVDENFNATCAKAIMDELIKVGFKLSYDAFANEAR